MQLILQTTRDKSINLCNFTHKLRYALNDQTHFIRIWLNYNDTKQIQIKILDNYVQPCDVLMTWKTTSFHVNTIINIIFYIKKK